jgi:hypothetical protein
MRDARAPLCQPVCPCACAPRDAGARRVLFAAQAGVRAAVPQWLRRSAAQNVQCVGRAPGCCELSVLCVVCARFILVGACACALLFAYIVIVVPFLSFSFSFFPFYIFLSFSFFFLAHLLCCAFFLPFHTYRAFFIICESASKSAQLYAEGIKQTTQ